MLLDQRPDGPLDRLRPADPARARLGRPARRGRGRPHRRRDRLARRHGGAPRRDPARPRVDVDDDQRAGSAAAPALRARRGGAGRAGDGPAGHRPERHPQGVRRPRELHLPAAALDAAHDRRVRLLRGARSRTGTRSRSPATTSARPGSTAAQELAFTLANGIAYCEAAVAAGLSPDDFGARLSFFFNAHNDFFVRRSRSSAPPARLWATGHARPVRRDEPQGAGAPVPHPDRRLDAHRPAAREQHRARRRSRRSPPSAAARSRCTPTRSTRRSRCPPSTPPRSRCARSRC